jgi:predicted PurR-regulated permease PerM
LNDSQRRIVGTALTLLAFISSLALVIATIYVTGQLLGYFSGVLWPIAVAGVLALILRPLVHRLEGRFKLRRITAVILLYGLVVVATAGALLLLAAAAGRTGGRLHRLRAGALWNKIAVPTCRPTTRSGSRTRCSKLVWRTRPCGRRSTASPRKASRCFAHAVPSLRAAFGGALPLGAAFLTGLAIVPVYLFFLPARPRRTRHRATSGTHPDLPQAGNVRKDVVFLIQRVRRRSSRRSSGASCSSACAWECCSRPASR